MKISGKIVAFFKEYLREIAATLSFSLLCHLVVGFVIDPPPSSIGRFIYVAIILSDLTATVLLLRSLWRSKWRAALAKTAQRLFEGLSRLAIRLMDRIFDRFGLKSQHNLIKGKTEVIFDSADSERQSSKRKKAKRWKHMESDRERLGFLYRGMITHRIKEGKRARSFDTPSELRTREENTPAEEELFALYIDARYDDRTEVKEEKVLSLKRRLETTIDIK